MRSRFDNSVGMVGRDSVEPTWSMESTARRSLAPPEDEVLKKPLRLQDFAG